jgi:hypothetical protein
MYICVCVCVYVCVYSTNDVAQRSDLSERADSPFYRTAERSHRKGKVHFEGRSEYLLVPA